MKHNLFIISGPSGAGKDTLIDELAKVLPIEKVITMTTRAMRPGIDVQGKPYYFISHEEFKEGIAGHRFFEYAQGENREYYGVTHQEIERVMNSDKIGIWELDYKGVITAKRIFKDIIAILINAPKDILIKRIKKRSNVSQEYIEERMAYTREWMKHKDIYDYEVINQEGKLDETIEEVAMIIKENLH